MNTISATASTTIASCADRGLGVAGIAAQVRCGTRTVLRHLDWRAAGERIAALTDQLDVAEQTIAELRRREAAAAVLTGRLSAELAVCQDRCARLETLALRAADALRRERARAAERQRQAGTEQGIAGRNV